MSEFPETVTPDASPLTNVRLSIFNVSVASSSLAFAKRFSVYAESSSEAVLVIAEETVGSSLEPAMVMVAVVETLPPLPSSIS